MSAQRHLGSSGLDFPEQARPPLLGRGLSPQSHAPHRQSIATRFAGRWSQARRREVAWRMLAEIEPARLITHRFPMSRADEAYDLLDQRPQEAVQVMLAYGA
ncbi:MAG: hypothetical protein ACT4QB_04040 [Gammaproteobacteria bacterium]